jgi:hypothetical protein
MKINQVVTENLADQFAAMARARGMNVRIAGTPEQERERSRQRMAQRDAERAQADSDAAQADLAQLPELKAKYKQMKDEYDSLGGNNWQYADREQNLTDRERQARDIEHELNSLGNRIARAEKSQGVAKDDVDEGVRVANQQIPGTKNRAKTAYYPTNVKPKVPKLDNPLTDQELARLTQLDKMKKGVAEGSKEKTQGIALSKAYKKDFDDKKPGHTKPDTALTGAYSKTGKPGGELKKKGVAEGSAADGSVNYTLGHTPDAEYVYSIYRDGKKEGTYHSVDQAKRIVANMKKSAPYIKYKITRSPRSKMAGPKGQLPEQGMAEVSDATLTSYLTKLDKDNLKHRMDPTKRSDTKRMKSGPNFVKAFTKLDNRKQGVAEGYQFKGPFPFDVDHMHGGRGINLPKAETKKYFTDKKQWEQAVNDINSSKYDDNSDYIGVTGRSTVEINGREWARWSDAQQKGYIELSSMSEQGVAEGNYDRDDYYNARQGKEYGRDLTATGYGGDGSKTRRDDIFKGQSKRLPADPFSRTSGAVPTAGTGRIHSTAQPDEMDEGDISQLEKDVADAPVAPIANMEGAKEKIGGRHDPADFDDMINRLKKLAGAGPMKTVYDPNTRRYKNMPTAVQPRDKK